MCCGVELGLGHVICFVAGGDVLVAESEGEGEIYGGWSARQERFVMEICLIGNRDFFIFKQLVYNDGLDGTQQDAKIKQHNCARPLKLNLFSSIYCLSRQCS